MLTGGSPQHGREMFREAKTRNTRVDVMTGEADGPLLASPATQDDETIAFMPEQRVKRRSCARVCRHCVKITLVSAVVAVLVLSLLLVWADWECLNCRVSALPTAYIPPQPNTRAADRASRREIQVLTYNTFLRMGYLTPDDHKNMRLQELIDELDAFDVVALQEVWPTFSQGRLHELIKGAQAKGFSHWVRAACAKPWAGRVVNSMLFVISRHPLSNIEETFYTSCSSTDCAARKGALGARVTPFGDSSLTFDLVTTHLNAGNANGWDESITEPLGVAARGPQLVELRDFVDARRQAKGFDETWPTLLAGDFNMAYGTAEAIDAFAGPLQSFHELCSSTPHCEGKTARDGIVGAPHEGESWPRIDYLFVKPAQPATFEVVQGSTRREPFLVFNHPFTTISDHFGLTTTLRFRSEAKR